MTKRLPNRQICQSKGNQIGLLFSVLKSIVRTSAFHVRQSGIVECEPLSFLNCTDRGTKKNGDG